ncbi:MAG: N-6 DNA methylase [Planctomycetota bacterium]
MAALVSALRKRLENAIRAARQAAETGARQALESLAVERHEPHGSMSPAQRELRNRLRAHGRQLGDARDSLRGTQSIARLVREVAYEHWHRMLFARFLAENGLLIEPTHGIAVTLAECEELAREKSPEGDPWPLAARFAQGMLPAIFRPDDPALAVALPPETRQELERLLAGLPVDVFTSDDALGWTYQFWQSAEKEAVNARVKSGEKITGETLPAVTQLFTEHYMVLFLLHNTLGAWHAGKVLAAQPELARAATSEADLRRAVAVEGCEWEYLRFVRAPRDGDEAGKPSGPWRPAAGAFPTWPRRAADLKVLDPCCGSGHFLVAAFEILVRLRMAEEGLAREAAIRAVLGENLHGLELDPRCTQLAAFCLALAAWRWVGRPIVLPPLEIACCALAPAATKEEWLALAEAAAAAGGMPAKRDLFRREDSLLSDALRAGFEALYEMFARAPELGSLIDPADLPSSLYQASFSALEPLLAEVLGDRDDERRERAVAAAGMARAAQILVGPSGGYTLVATNVPYLGRKSHTEELKAWVDANHKEAKNDWATVFLSRMLRWVGKSGTVAAVTPQNWLFLTGYRKLRERLLEQNTWCSVARLGPGAFETIGGHVVNVALVTITGSVPEETHVMAGVDVTCAQSPIEKAALLRGETGVTLETAPQTPERTEAAPEKPLDSETDDEAKPSEPEVPPSSADGSVRLIPQIEQLKNPDSRVALAVGGDVHLLSEFAQSCQGTATGDDPRARRKYWELTSLASTAWVLGQTSPDSPAIIAGCTELYLWGSDGDAITWPGAAVRGRGAWGRAGIGIASMSGMWPCLYLGGPYDQNLHVLVPNKGDRLAAMWAFCSSPGFAKAVRRIDQKLNVTNATVAKVPFDVAHWQRVADDGYPMGLPESQSNDPTQWLFHGHPAGMLAAGPAARSPFGIADPIGADRHPSLLCREPNPRDVLQVAVARLLGYRWPPEHDESMRLDLAARAWVGRCRDLEPFADREGIVCLPSVRGEPSAAERLRRLLAAALAEAPGGFTAPRERELLAAAGGDGQPAESLEDWLRERFFAEHCALFHSRPLVWHVWDGRRDGFGALVHYHRLAAPEGEGRRLLESLAFASLGEWIDRQRAEQGEGREGADARLAAALRLQGELRRILEGEPPYDLFVRWKPLAEQPIGWEPDLDDGVRLNIRPFLTAEDMGRKGAGLLRVRPKSIRWEKDRGKEPESLRPRLEFPWFWGCDPEEKPAHRTDFGAPLPDRPAAGKAFDGRRWNDLHYTRAAKEAARAAARQGAAP